MSKAYARSRTRRSGGSRLWLRVGPLVAIALFLAVGGVYLYQTRVTAQPLIGGAIANPPQPAPNFALTDQFGQSQSLAALLGKPVALTFIYTSCPDICPIISANMHRAYGLLASGAAQTAMLAVTVDPERDDVQQVRAYSDRMGLTGQWHFLTASRPQLEAVWAAYGIDARKTPGGPGAGAAADTAEQIEHAAPVFLIDKHGRVRAMLPTNVTGDDLAHDLSILAGEQ